MLLKIGDFVDFIDLAVSRREADFLLSETARWYCAVLGKSSRHRRAQLDLTMLGYRSFYPRTKRWVSHARVKTAKEYPILGRYIFVEIDHARSSKQSFAEVRELFDIEGFISNIGNPSHFPHSYIESLLIRYMKGEWDETLNGKIPVGARIRIMEGEFADRLATVINAKGKKVHFKLLGESRISNTHESLVRAA